MPLTDSQRLAFLATLSSISSAIAGDAASTDDLAWGVAALLGELEAADARAPAIAILRAELSTEATP